MRIVLLNDVRETIVSGFDKFEGDSSPDMLRKDDTRDIERSAKNEKERLLSADIWVVYGRVWRPKLGAKEPFVLRTANDE